MKRNYYLTLIWLLVLLNATCATNNRRYELPIIKENNVEIADLDPQRLSDTITIKLSQIADNINIVKLETNEDCLLSETSRYAVGEKFITFQQQTGVYQFSIDGTYIRRIVSVGNGPGEIPTPSFIGFMDENKDTYIVLSRNYFYFYRLSSGEFLGTKNRIPEIGSVISSLLISEDSLILCSYGDVYTSSNISSDSLSCGIVIMDWSASLIKHLQFTYKTCQVAPNINMEFIHGSGINILKTEHPEEFILNIENHDTIYKINIKDYALKPYLLYRTEGNKKNGIPVTGISVGSYMEIDQYASAYGNQIMAASYITNIPIDYPASFLDAESYYIIYDNNHKLAYNIGSFENDYLGFVHHRIGSMQNLISYPSLKLPNGKLIILYNAYDFLNLTETALNNPRLSKEIADRIRKLSDGLTESNNPIIVIADMKKELNIK